MDKNGRQTKSAKAKAEEETLNRILCWVVGGAVLEFLLLLLNRYWTHYTVAQIDFRLALGTAVKILAVVALVGVVAAAFWWKKTYVGEKKAYLPGTVCLFLAGVSVSCFAAWFFSGTGIQLMYVAVPAVIVMALIFYLYQREFFLLACQGLLALLGVWVCARGIGSSQAWLCYAYVVVAAVVTLLSAWLCRKAQGANGTVEWKGRKLRLFPKANYGFLYAGAVITLLVLIGAAVGLGKMLLYAVTVAWVLIAAVYYTVKLM
jgi:hypothetical protein